MDDQASPTLTVQAPSSDVYVSNTSGCGGNTPCYTGPDALQNAFDDVAAGGTVNVYGTWSQGGGNTAQLTGTKSVTLTGFNAPRIENGGGTCGGAMIDNNSSGTLTVKNLTIDGTCGTGSRSAGILSSSGTTHVTDNANTIRDFTGAGNAGIDVGGGTVVVSGNSFINNEAAMEQSGGTLYAFANNVTSTTGSNAAVSTGGTSDVKCNYWGSATISGFGSDYAARLGAPAVSYAEGTGAQTLGNAALAGTGSTQVLVSMGRDTDSPPFNNGTTGGLGALVSDFFAACSSQGGGTPIGAITITGDSVTPGTDGFRLYEVQNADDCSPSDNVDCWDYAGAVDVNGDPTGSAHCTGLVGCTVTDETASEGNFVVGNETDPTAITLSNLTVTSARNTWVPVALVVTSLTLVGGLFLARRRRENS